MGLQTTNLESTSTSPLKHVSGDDQHFVNTHTHKVEVVIYWNTKSFLENYGV